MSMARVHLDPSTRERLNALDGRYDERAYAFVLSALEEVVACLPRRRHVSGEELVEGCRELALRLYGPMAKTVLEHWRIHGTRDFGEIVFNLLDVGVLSKDDADSRHDFDDLFDFTEVFERKYPWGGRSLA
ncbi:MAG TPA: Minf_1886 family protein [Gemmatimonadota bacterium]|nr:Minf_1886 family protein [Gemmatimonadota bacterium]